MYSIPDLSNLHCELGENGSLYVIIQEGNVDVINTVSNSVVVYSNKNKEILTIEVKNFWSNLLITTAITAKSLLSKYLNQKTVYKPEDFNKIVPYIDYTKMRKP